MTQSSFRKSKHLPDPLTAKALSLGVMLQIRKWAERALGFRDSAVREIMSLCLRYTCVLLFLSVSQLMLRS